MKTLLMRAWRRFGAYGLALAAALATAWAVREHVGQGEPEPVAANAPVVERLVAAEDLAAGTRLDESHLQRRQVPAAWAPRASLDPLAAQALLGAVLSADIDAGEIILPAHLLGQPAGQASTAPAAQLALPAGMRALNVTVADLGPLAGRLRVGDSVDVYASFVHDGKRNAAPVLLAAGPVRRRVGRRWRAGHGERHAGGPPRDALRFVAARQGGILTAMLRHRDDAVAVGDEDLADPAALQGMPAEPSGGRRCHSLRRPAGWPGAARRGRPIRRRGRRGAAWR